MVDTAEPETGADIDSAVAQALDSDEFAPYEHRDEILVELERTKGEIASEINSSYLSYSTRRDAQRSLEAALPRKIRRQALLAIGIGLLCVLVSIVAITLDVRDAHLGLGKRQVIGLGPEGIQRWTVALSIFGLLMLAGWLFTYIDGLHAEIAEVSAEATNEQKAYSEIVGVRVHEALRRAINRILGPQGLLIFPTVAPRLVELNSAKVVPSATLRYVREFIAEHESSAIGIAGTRGSGKTTLMRELADESGFCTSKVFVSAPVRYEAADFTRRLFLEAAYEIDKSVGETHLQLERSRYRRIETTRAIAGAAIASIGMLIVISEVLFFDASRFHFGITAGIGTTLLLYGGALYVYAMLHRISTARRRAPTTANLAVKWIERLTLEVEESRSSTNALKLPGFMEFAAEDSETYTTKSIELSVPDLAREMTRLLTQYSRERDNLRFVFFIDELDKLSSVDDLVEAVNGIKDLFHIPGVHFVVSVSTDALARFQRRGLPARDAFDSAFDAIVNVRRLTPNEAVEVIRSRSADFPPALSVFCFAWSGGLPRDLLRAARRCIEIRRETDNVSLCGLVSGLVSADLSEAVTASLSTDLKAPDVRAVLELEDVHQELHRECDAASLLERTNAVQCSDPAVSALALRTQIAIMLVELCRHFIDEDAWWDADLSEISPKADLLASCISMSESREEERAAVLRRAVTELVRPPL